MSKEISVGGIYDLETISQLRHIHLNNFGFDFRPKSFNFLQQHLVVDILKKCHRSSDRYFFHFQNEKDYIIFEYINYLKKTVPFCNNFFLEFSDHMEPSYYEKFSHPFYWYYQSESLFEEIVFLSDLQGIILPHSLLLRFYERGNLNDFISYFLRVLANKKMEVVLSLEWKYEISPFIFELLNFDMISFSINQDVEYSYRNVNINLLKKELSYHSNIFEIISKEQI